MGFSYSHCVFRERQRGEMKHGLSWRAGTSREKCHLIPAPAFDISSTSKSVQHVCWEYGLTPPSVGPVVPDSRAQNGERTNERTASQYIEISEKESQRTANSTRPDQAILRPLSAMPCHGRSDYQTDNQLHTILLFVASARKSFVPPHANPPRLSTCMVLCISPTCP